MNKINLKLKTYDELTFEISQLNTDKYLLEQKLQQKENIIKEVREYIDTLEKQHAYKFVEVDNHTEMRIDENEYLVWCKYNKLLKILDKGE